MRSSSGSPAARSPRNPPRPEVAATAQGRQLTEAHRLAQVALGAQTVKAMRAIWPLLDPTAIDATVERWLTAAIPIVTAQRASSARLAGNYLATFKALEVRTAQLPLVLDDAPVVEAVTTSLLVTGPHRLRKALSISTPLIHALSTAEAGSSAAAMRHVLNGGRSTITGTVAADPRAAGWARVTSGAACEFCSMLEGRGAVYSEGTVDFEAHDGCACTAEPVFAN